VIDLEGDAALARDLAAGGVFVPGCALRMAEECELVVCAADRQVSLPARVVYVDPQGGAGLELIGFSTAMREQLAELSPAGHRRADAAPRRAATLRDHAFDDLALPRAAEAPRAPRTWPEASAQRPPSPGDRRARRLSSPSPFDEDGPTRRAPGRASFDAARAQRPSSPSPFDDGPAQRPSSPSPFDAARAKPPSSPSPFDDARAQRPSRPALFDSARAQRPSSPALFDSARAKPPSSPSPFDDAPDRPAPARWHYDGRSTRPASIPPTDEAMAVPLAFDDDARTIPMTTTTVARRDDQDADQDPDRVADLAADLAPDDDLALPMAPELERVLRRWTGSMDSDPALAIAGAEADPAFFDANDEPSATHAEPVALPELDVGDSRRPQTTTGADPAGADLALDDALAMLDAWPDGGDGIAGHSDSGPGDRGPGPSRGAAENGDEIGDENGEGIGDELDEVDDPNAPRTGSGRTPRNVHERLRGLSLAAQLKLAASGELPERIVLERLYGKNVWETLLRNPRLTPPEVARIARYGSLPRVLLEIVVANNAWLQVPEVRRALLCNPRLGTDQIVKVLRVTPKHELRLAAVQTAYPQAVRSAARTLLRGE